MAIIPGTKNFDVYKRSDFGLRLTLKDSTSTAIDLTGYTVAAQVWDGDEYYYIKGNLNVTEGYTA